MKTPSYLSLLSLVAVSTTAVVPQTQSGLNVSIVATGNTQITAVITNIGTTSLRLLKEGTIFDRAPVEKFRVNSLGGRRKVRFEGIRKVINYSNLTNAAFQTLEAGKSIEISVDIASIHDLTSGGEFQIDSNSRIPVATGVNNDITGSVQMISNEVLIDVNGTAAGATLNAIAKTRKRGLRAWRLPSAPNALISADCTGTNLQIVKNALARAAILSTNASKMAATGSVSRFEEYFGYSTDRTRKLVSDRFTAVSDHCAGRKSHPDVSLHCVDQYQYCSDATLAYTLPGVDYIVNCASYFTDLPLQTTKCHGQDQTTTAIHELTHAYGIYDPGTQDLAYGYENDMLLPPADKPLNADNYALYANALAVGC